MAIREAAQDAERPRRSLSAPLSNLADRVIVLWGWRRFLLAVIMGGLSALALAPYDLFPILFVTLPVFVWLIDGAAARPDAGLLRRAFAGAWVGWAFGFGYFLAGLWWVGAAFLVDGDQFAWLMPFAVLVLPAGLALFWGLGAALARWFWSDGWPRVLVFAIVMSGAEWLRGHVLGGFPWNALGYALTPTPLMMQSASVVGLWGLTLAAFTIFAAPAALVSGSSRRRWLMPVVALVLLAAHVGFGAVRLAGATDQVVSGVRLRLVQPNLAEGDKWRPEKGDEILKQYLALSDGATSPERSGVGSATHLIWPESAFPFLLTERPEALAAIAALLPEGTTLITGAARADPAAAGSTSAPVFNSIYVIDDKGEIRSAYDKVHLVPFGEYLPWRSVFDALGLRQLIALPGGFAAGTRRSTLAVPGAPFAAPLICYEAVFPGEVVAPGERPGWLLNVTNDAWYGDTPGPRQHFAQARLRAVEEGLPLVRAANSGISAIVDSYGRVERSLGVGAAGLVDGDLPASLPPTFYAIYGDFIFAGLLLAASAIAGLGQLTEALKRN